MDVDIADLADPVQPSDPLLEHLGIARETEEDEVSCELEIPTLGADLRA